jgi:membrane associated rhomboid family serine protease
MFVPYEVDAPFDRRPVVNWLVISLIVLVFILQVVTSEKQAAAKPKKGINTPLEEMFRESEIQKATAKQEEKKPAVAGPMVRFALNGWGLGLFTYIWLHGGVLRGVVRVVVNLIFLWPFGNAVCAKIGNKLYLLFYLGFGLLAGVIHLLLSDRMAVGADSVICGIVGIYIVLFPEDTMSCFFLLPRPMAVSISGGWVVALWFIFDILESALGGQSTTYCAHILCAGAGAGLAILMLKKKWLVMESDEKSLLQMLSKKEEKEEEKGKGGEKKGEEQESKEVEAVEKQPAPAERARQEPPKAAPEAVKAEDDFIRFKCECGHRIKVHKRDAGKAGRCPKCMRWVEAPRK